MTTDKRPETVIRSATIRVPLTRPQRRREAAIVVKKYRDDLLLLGIDPAKARRDLAKWDGVSDATMPEWLREHP